MITEEQKKRISQMAKPVVYVNTKHMPQLSHLSYVKSHPFMPEDKILIIDEYELCQK